MIKIESNWLDLRQLDEFSMRGTVIHRLNPLIKVLVTMAFILGVSSFPKYDITGLLPFFFYPWLLLSLTDLPVAQIIRRLLLVAPFVLFVGIFNPLFDQTPLIRLGPVLLTGGWISFFSTTIKLSLTVSAALILMASTGMNAICTALLRLGMPKVFIVQLLFMYRYLHVLVEISIRTVQAYRLRSFHETGIRYKAWGSLLGQLLLRTLERARHIYQAMLCRGFNGDMPVRFPDAMRRADILYFVGWIAFFLFARLVNIPYLLGRLVMGGGFL